MSLIGNITGALTDTLSAVTSVAQEVAGVAATVAGQSPIVDILENLVAQAGLPQAEAPPEDAGGGGGDLGQLISTIAPLIIV
jgi:hypothetical protein